MVALVQRVREASVTIEDDVVGAIGHGLLILLGIHAEDTPDDVAWLSRKCARLRIFADEDGRMNNSLQDVQGEALVVSQFTLYGDARKGNRPSYTDAARPEVAEPLYEQFVADLNARLSTPVATGRFGAMMQVALVNDGPVTLWVERT